MKVFEEQYQLRLPRSHGRSPGLHISDVIRDYALTTGRLDKRWAPSEVPIEDQDTELMQVGLAWEDYLAAHQYPDIDFHPGEYALHDDELCECGHPLDVHLSGKYDCSFGGCTCEMFRPRPIFMSPDGASPIDPDDYADLFAVSSFFIHEFKFTQKSSRDFRRILQYREKKGLMWLWQIACYCLATGTLAAKLHVMFINGDYSRSGDTGVGKRFKVFRIEWERSDLEEIWVMLRNHARTMQCR